MNSPFYFAKRQPKILPSFKAALETVASHIYLILFPLLLDLYLLLGQHLSLNNLFQPILNRVTIPDGLSADLLTRWNAGKLLLEEFFRYFNLGSTLHTLPIGIPSLFSTRLFKLTPLGSINSYEFTNFGQLLLSFIGLALVGLLFACLYFSLCARATEADRPPFQMQSYLRSLVTFLAIPLITLLFCLIIFVPAILIISLITSLSPFLGSLSLIILVAFLLRRLFPFFFSPFIASYGQEGLLGSVKKSMQVIQPTSATSSLFVILAFLIYYLSNYLWQIPADGSWMLLIGAFGHALISTVLMVACFHFLHEAQDCVAEATQSPEIA